MFGVHPPAVIPGKYGAVNLPSKLAAASEPSKPNTKFPDWKL